MDQEAVPPNPPRFSLGPSELFVAIPLAGSALAITWDVGFFWVIGINYFTFFSLSEHIVFALQAVPLAFVFCIFILIIWVPYFKEAAQLKEAARRGIALPKLTRKAWWIDSKPLWIQKAFHGVVIGGAIIVVIGPAASSGGLSGGVIQA